MSLSNGKGEFSNINIVLAKNTPLVLFDTIAKIVKCSKVSINHRKTAYQAVFLLKKDFKKSPILKVRIFHKFPSIDF